MSFVQSLPSSFLNQFWRVCVFTGVVLFVPLVAMQFTSEVRWNGFDFAVMAGLCFFFGGLWQWCLSHSGRWRQVLRLGIVVAFFLLWAQLAVGIIS